MCCLKPGHASGLVAYCRGWVRLLISLCMVALVPLAPAHAQSTAQTIESDDPRVFQNGIWASQPTPAASNGNYLYSSGAEADILGLSFVGSAIEIIYVSGPQLGTLSIEIDGTVLRTVITTAEKTTYGQSARITYLSDEPHSLKVYAQAGGIIAVDAFVIVPISGPLSTTVEGEQDGGIQSSTCAPLNATHRVSLTSTGQQSNAHANSPAISSNGRYVSFVTAARLVNGEDNGVFDVFLYDRQTCETELISVSSTGAAGNSDSQNPAISGDGRYIAFTSTASSLVPTDTNLANDIFVHDRQTNTTTRVSVGSGGATEGNGGSIQPSISADGRYIAFSSGATNLVTGDTNSRNDVFVHDRQTGTTTRVSVVTGGAQAIGGHSIQASISADGRYIAFSSGATNLVAGDTNAQNDIFVHDRQTGTTTRVSVATGGTQATGGSSFVPVISADGRYIAFESNAVDLVMGDTNNRQDVFVHDRQTNATTRASVTTSGAQTTLQDSSVSSISDDGRYVTFYSLANNFITGDTNAVNDVFLRDRQTNTTTRISLTSTSAQGTGGGSFTSAISTDGRYVAFVATATNLVTGDTNAQDDMFVTPLRQPVADMLALFNPAFEQVNLLDTLGDNPVTDHYTAFSVYPPITPPGQWVMGDWNGDGLKTPGVYANGPFYYTNKSGESQASDWRSLWIGVAGVPVSGRFSGALPNDCIGAVQQVSSSGQTVFVLYFTCDLSGNTIPLISSQWLSAVLPDSGGFSGVHQFGAGDFNGDGADSIAVRRGTFIAFGNVAPVTGPATFDLAQFIGAPQPGPDAGIFVVGSWDGDIFDSFGLFYQNGEFFFRNDHLFNSGAYGNQSVGQPFAGTVQATTWR